MSSFLSSQERLGGDGGVRGGGEVSGGGGGREVDDDWVGVVGIGSGGGEWGDGGDDEAEEGLFCSSTSFSGDGGGRDNPGILCICRFF